MRAKCIRCGKRPRTSLTDLQCDVCRENDLKIEVHDQLVKALFAAKTHLEACEEGRIHHPYKSASLPLVREALKAAGEEI